jgi:hypothetical protein
MLIGGSRALPVRIASVIEADESVIDVLPGLAASGFVLTERHVFGWRSNGIGGPLPLAAIERVLVDEDDRRSRADIVLLPRLAACPALALAVRARAIDDALAFIRAIATARSITPLEFSAGPIHRFLFADAMSPVGDAMAFSGERRFIGL